MAIETRSKDQLPDETNRDIADSPSPEVALEHEISIKSSEIKNEIFYIFLDRLIYLTTQEVESEGSYTREISTTNAVRDLVSQCVKDLGILNNYLPVFWIRLGITDFLSDQDLKDVAFQASDAPMYVSETDDRPNKVSEQDKKIAKYFLRMRDQAAKDKFD